MDARRPQPPGLSVAAPIQRRSAAQAGPVRAPAPMQPRLYPNLRPVGLVPLEQEQFFTLHEWAGRFGMRANGGRGLHVPNARYIFVRTQGSETLMHPRLRHAALARGEPVRYAGEAYFESGALRWWSNASGHYRPDVEHAPQAGLPMALFRSWDDVVRRGSRPQPPPGAGML